MDGGAVGDNYPITVWICYGSGSEEGVEAGSAVAVAADKSLHQPALERGVRIRTLYLESARHDPQTAAYARWMGGLGGHSRTVPTLPIGLVVVDREIALVPGKPETHRRELRS